MQKIERAPEQRTFSERVIDKYLRKIEKDPHNEKLEAKYSNNSKKIKPNEEFIPKTPQSVIPNEALDKILKHLGNVQKAPKALALIIQLIDTHMNELHHHHLFETLFIIMKNFEFFVDFNSKKNVYGIEKVFSTFSKNLKEIFQKTHEGLAEKLNKKEKTLLEIMSKYAEYSYQMSTDDSYQFHACVKKVMNYFEELSEEFQTKEDFDDSEEDQEEVEIENDNKKNDILEKIRGKLLKKTEAEKNEEEKPSEEFVKKVNYDYKLSEELQNLLAKEEKIFNYKKSTIHSLIIESYKNYSREWAKSSINILLNEVFYRKDVFDEKQIQMIENIMREVSLKKQKNLNKNLIRNNLDDKILGNPLISKNEVTDARTVVYSNDDDGLGKWSSRQCGL